MRIIDVHAHYFPEAYLEVFNADGKRLGAEYTRTAEGFSYKIGGAVFGPISNKFVDLERRLDDMDQEGVAIQLLSLTGPMAYWGDAALNERLARAWNDAASAAHLEHPTRLFVLATLPLPSLDRALAELERASELPGVRGVYLGTIVNQKTLDDPLFEPLWARIEALNLPVFTHPLGAWGGTRMSRYHLANLVGFPVDAALAACHLIFGGVLDRHPRLEVCISHAGGALPTLIGRIDHGWKVRPELRHLERSPSSYLRRFYYDGLAHSKDALALLIATVGADRVMLGSDYCFDMGCSPRLWMESLGLDPASRTMIAGETAAKLLRL